MVSILTITTLVLSQSSNSLFNYNIKHNKIIRDLSLMVKYETFNLCYMGSNPIGLNLIL